MMDFHKYARANGVSSLALDSYIDSTTPFIVEQSSKNLCTMDIFSKLLNNRIVWLGDEIDSEVANIIVSQLLYLQMLDDKEDITMYINTPGGCVDSGLSIYDTMQFISPDVCTITTGLAASMGSILLSGGTKGKRKALPHAKILLHQPLGGAAGQTSDVLIAAKEMEKCRTELFSILAENCGKSYEQIAADADRDFWMTSEEALKYSIIDQVINGK